ncbi:MAG: tRNA (N6-threonylcarbamoyladenosine(37)-N6)-methyltransferase TrmO [Chitinivibrionales bacterium]|nr:tRNA (N6-threonylcarbamoyladenosine(37)-N6)-methyltransferase TrmO [Chitinivibrionales bacterium]
MLSVVRGRRTDSASFFRASVLQPYLISQFPRCASTIAGRAGPVNDLSGTPRTPTAPAVHEAFSRQRHVLPVNQGGTVELHPIGTIHTPYTSREGMPIQPAGAAGVQGTVKLFDEYRPGLQDLDGFSHVILLYLFHRSDGYKLRVVPFMDTRPHGVFATRAPKRPNPIGLSVVKLRSIDGGVLHVQDVDVLDGTPLLDIKPYVPEFDSREEVRTGWLEEARKTVQRRRSDDRFA